MNSTLTAFALTFIAGLSTGLGGLLTLLLGKFYKDFPAHLLGFLLSFSSGVMIFISIFDLMLEAIYELDFLHWLIYTALGSGGFALFLRFIPNDEQFLALGLHSSSSKQGTRSKKPSKIDAAIIRTALVTSLGVSAHNLPEGIAVYFSALKGLHLGIPMTVAIAMHNIPEGICVAAPLYFATRDWKIALKISILSGLCEPLGALLLGFLFHDLITPTMITTMLSMVGGIMIYMCVVELIPSSLKTTSVQNVLFGHFCGAFAMFLVSWSCHNFLGVDLV